jgi:hypothetical protein
MEMTVYNPQKGRFETIDVEITDFKGGVIIKELGYGYPIWLYDVTRSEIGHS